MSGKNREKQRVNKENKRAAEQNHLIADAERKHVSHFNLDWFQPTAIQHEIVQSYYYNDLTCVQGSSGTGKSTTAIWLALKDLKDRRVNKIIFCKTPAELGDDKIGFTPGDKKEKLEPHFNTMRGVFHSFMTKEKLVMEEAHGNIEMTIPNFMVGATLDNCIFVVDEGQLLSSSTTKLVLERAGQNCKVVLLGDSKQRYAKDKRNDGFSDFINRITREEDGERVTKVGGMGYVEMRAADNMRSELSRAIVELYEE
jgi:phosphate starvation-inducible protein PhoH